VPGHAGITGKEVADEEANKLLRNRSRTMKSTHQRIQTDGLRRKWRAADKERGKNERI
jgi:hypothetical protein